jgi:multiple sugar transport system permease protein
MGLVNRSGEAVAPARSQARGLQRMRAREAIHGYIFMLPAILGLLIFLLGPIVVSLYLSFTRYDLLTPPQWIGLGNYQTLFKDPLFWQSLRVSALYSVISVPLGLAFSLLAAVLLDQKMRGIAIFRSIYYLPTVISGVGVAMLWRWMFNSQYGVINVLLGKLGIDGPSWITDERWALPALIFASLWGIGGTMLIFLAGLQGIPTELYEAAEIDGAGRFRQFLAITVPMLSHVTFFNLVLGIIGALQNFTDAFVMTGGGPNNATLFLTLYLYRNAFLYLNMGFASAVAWVLFLIVLMLTLAVFRSSPLWVFYETEQRRPA